MMASSGANGQPLHICSYINEPMEYSRKGEIKIPAAGVFCMGDNRNHSCDSRFIGPVSIDHVLGHVIW